MKEVILEEAATDKVYLNQVETGKIIVRTHKGNSRLHCILLNINSMYCWVGLRTYYNCLFPVGHKTIAEAIKNAKNNGFRVHIFEGECDLAMNLRKIT